MGFGALRSVICPFSITLLFRTSTSPTTSLFPPSPSPKLDFCFALRQSPWFQISSYFIIFSESNHFDGLTDSRFPKRRPQDKPRRKRANLRPPIGGKKAESSVTGG
ncbi:hypothetical protein P3X46_029231 [Hevea brasiliensis]|uniref:Uncharacterized protein n=1 Tax=Hevea brasiliensis TaxID=3981 RepID=A0ABQ9KRJ2_HEVBR|nr:hypothetical protein P3X46_029231 [Hevea brasiliensis]